MANSMFQFFIFVKENWDTAILIALLLFSLFKGIEQLDDKTLDGLLEKDPNIKISTKIFSAWTWSMASNALNPTIRYDVPFINGYLIPINDIPFFDSTDLIFMIPLFLIVYWPIRFFWKKNPNQAWKYILMLLLWIIAIFLITKLIWYFIYLLSSHNIGFTTQQAIDVRENILEGLDKVTGILIVLPILGGWAIYSNLKKKKK